MERIRVCRILGLIKLIYIISVRKMILQERTSQIHSLVTKKNRKWSEFSNNKKPNKDDINLFVRNIYEIEVEWIENTHL